MKKLKKKAIDKINLISIFITNLKLLKLKFKSFFFGILLFKFNKKNESFHALWFQA